MADSKSSTRDDDAWLYGDKEKETNKENDTIEKVNLSQSESLNSTEATTSTQSVVSTSPALTTSTDTDKIQNQEKIDSSATVSQHKVMSESEDDDDDDDDDDVEVHIGDIKTQSSYDSSKFKTGYQRQATSVTSSSKQLPPKGVDMEAVGTINSTPLYEFETENLQSDEKPWNKPGADITDYFNYGFTEDTWKIYCDRQKKLRQENGVLKTYNTPWTMSISSRPPGHIGTDVKVDGSADLASRRTSGTIGVIGSTSKDSRRPRDSSDPLSQVDKAIEPPGSFPSFTHPPPSASIPPVGVPPPVILPPPASFTAPPPGVLTSQVHPTNLPPPPPGLQSHPPPGFGAPGFFSTGPPGVSDGPPLPGPGYTNFNPRFPPPFSGPSSTAGGSSSQWDSRSSRHQSSYNRDWDYSGGSPPRHSDSEFSSEDERERDRRHRNRDRERDRYPDHSRDRERPRDDRDRSRDYERSREIERTRERSRSRDRSRDRDRERRYREDRYRASRRKYDDRRREDDRYDDRRRDDDRYDDRRRDDDRYDDRRRDEDRYDDRRRDDDRYDDRRREDDRKRDEERRDDDKGDDRKYDEAKTNDESRARHKRSKRSKHEKEERNSVSTDQLKQPSLIPSAIPTSNEPPTVAPVT